MVNIGSRLLCSLGQNKYALRSAPEFEQRSPTQDGRSWQSPLALLANAIRKCATADLFIAKQFEFGRAEGCHDVLRGERFRHARQDPGCELAERAQFPLAFPFFDSFGRRPPSPQR